MPAPSRTAPNAWLRGVALRGALAAAAVHRRRLEHLTFIAITGSCGKTTTKDLIAGILGTTLRGRKTPASDNGFADVAKTVLRARRTDSYCVVEIAAWEPGTVARAARIVVPHIAVVTNVGSDHRKAFRTLEATAAEKRRLLDAVPDDGTAVLNIDDENVRAMTAGFHGRAITVGRSPDAIMRAEDVRSRWPERLAFTVRFEGQTLPVRTRLCGDFWVTSALAALAAATAAGMTLGEAVEALRSIEPTPHRMRPIRAGGVTFVLDDAKAPFWSLPAAFRFLADARAPRKVAIVGTISDYAGTSSRRYATAAAQALAAADEVLFVGPHARHALKGKSAASAGQLRAFGTLPEASAHLRTSLREDDLVLVKGSTADGLDRIVAGADQVRRGLWATR